MIEAREGTRRRCREATPERWRQALERAVLADVQVRQLQGTGQWIVTSASDPTAAYETDGVECTCAAAMLGGDPVCLHRAAYWHHLGMFDPTPEPPLAAAVPVPRTAGEWLVALGDEQRRATWSGHWRTVARLDRQLSLLSGFETDTHLMPCEDCRTGAGRLDEWSYCATCNGLELVPAVATLRAVA